MSTITGCIIEKSKDNRNIFRIKRDNKWIYIGSKYSVSRDVDNFINKILETINDEQLLFIFGLGAGEHIVELLQYISQQNKVVIIEPNDSVLKSFRELEYYNRIVLDKKIEIIRYDDVFLSDKIVKYIDSLPNMEFFIYSNYDKIYNEEILKTIEILKKYKKDKSLENNTLINCGKSNWINYVNNIDTIVSSIPINNIKNLYKDKSAIIVSAGPSLDKNINLLKEYRENFIIICGLRTLKPLLNIGVKPDFICVLDFGDKIYEIGQPFLQYDIPLVYHIASNHNFIREYTGNKIFFNTYDIEKNYLNNLINKKVDTIIQGGSVAHICMGLAKYLGCINIIFIGQDLAYTGEKLHSDSSTLKTEGGNIGMYDDNIYVEDINGDKIRTSFELDSYRRYIEFYISILKNINFINSTEGGANIKGTKVMTLKEALNEYGKRFKRKSIKEFCHNSNIDKKHVVVEINNVMKYIEEIIVKSEEYLQDLYKNKIDFKNIKMYTETIPKHEYYDFIYWIIYPIVLKSNNKQFYTKFSMNEYEKINILKKKYGFFLNSIKSELEEAVNILNKLNLED
ncbi:TPA: motility associated factor glycosyltransferase family protein [Clostridium sporogenes]